MKLTQRMRFRLGARTARRLARSMIREVPNLVVLLVNLVRDRRVALLDKSLFALVLAYVLIPSDLLPDFIAVLGLVDDLYLVGLALGRLFANAGPDLLLEHWRGEPAILGYFVESVDQLGGLLPRSIRNALRRTVDSTVRAA